MTPTELTVPKDVQGRFTPAQVECCRFAEAVVQGISDTKSRYMVLCKHIRETNMTPKEVSQACAAGRMSKERISEIKKICFTSDQIFKLYVQGTLSYKAALLSARNGSEVTPRVKWDRILSSFDRLVNAGESVNPFIHIHEKKALILFDLGQLVDGQKTFKFKKHEVTVKEIK